jgi:hypothetical protein
VLRACGLAFSPQAVCLDGVRFLPALPAPSLYLLYLLFDLSLSIYLYLSIYLSLSLSSFLGLPYTGVLESLESVQGPEGLEPYSCWLSLVFTHALMCYLFVCFTAQGRKVKRW